jgi:gliding motility-associated-like protein
MKSMKLFSQQTKFLKVSLFIGIFLCLNTASYSQNWLWAKSAGGTDGHSEGWAVSADVNGNVFICGYFYSSTITFGSTVLTNASVGSADLFLAKYDANGNILWAKSAGGVGANEDYAYSVKADISGNVFVTGSYESPTITFGSVTLTNAGASDIFLTKYDANGNVLWAKSTGGTDYDIGNSVSADGGGNVFITGYFYSSTIAFGSTGLTSTGGADIFIAKYDANGNVVWAKGAGGIVDDKGYSVSTDANGNVYATGWFQFNITFGSTTLTTVGNADAYITKYDANGNVLWTKDIGGTSIDYGFSVSTEIGGGVFLTGSFLSPSITSGTTTLNQPPGPSDPMFIIKYDASGNELCASALASGGDDNNSVTTDPLGDVYIGGDFAVTPFAVGPYNLILTDEEDVFVAKYSCCAVPTAVVPTNNSFCAVANVPASNFTSNPPGATFSWSSSNTTIGITASGSGNTPAFTAINSTTSPITATITVIPSANGCTGSPVTYSITVNPLPAVTVSPATICSGQSTTLTATGGDTYSWNTGATTNSITVNPSTTSTYSVIANNSFSCADTATSMVTVNAYPVAAINNGSPDTTICYGSTLTLTANGNGTYSWNPNATTSSINVNPLAYTTYSVVVDNNGCKDTANINVDVKPSPTVNAGEDLTLSCGTSAQLNAAGNGTFSWLPTTGLSCSNCPNPIVSPSETTQYCVTVTGANGCTNSDCVTIKMDVELTTPNAFSPDGDGHNDFFVLQGWKNNCVEQFSMIIYDRWGEKIFETTDPDKGWDGTSNGKKMDAAVFVYYISATLYNGEKINRKGNVSLIR